MSNLHTAHVLSVHHWNDTLFSFRTTREASLRFENGHFVMVGLPSVHASTVTLSSSVGAP